MSKTFQIHSINSIHFRSQISLKLALVPHFRHSPPNARLVLLLYYFRALPKVKNHLPIHKRSIPSFPVPQFSPPPVPPIPSAVRVRPVPIPFRPSPIRAVLPLFALPVPNNSHFLPLHPLLVPPFLGPLGHWPPPPLFLNQKGQNHFRLAPTMHCQWQHPQLGLSHN